MIHRSLEALLKISGSIRERLVRRESQAPSQEETALQVISLNLQAVCLKLVDEEAFRIEIIQALLKLPSMAH